MVSTPCIDDHQIPAENFSDDRSQILSAGDTVLNELRENNLSKREAKRQRKKGAYAVIPDARDADFSFDDVVNPDFGAIGGLPTGGTSSAATAGGLPAGG